jgi:TRAP transporter TAXI family solute receptor
MLWTCGVAFIRAVTLGTIAVAIMAAAGCRRPDPPAVTNIAIATGSRGGVFHAVGSALAAAYSQQVPALVATAQPSRGLSLEASVDALERGEIDLAFNDSETAYVAYKKGTTADGQPHIAIRAIAVLFPTVVHIFAKRDAGIERVTDFRGKRVDVGPRGSEPEQAVRLIFDSYGLGYPQMRAVFGSKSDPADEIRKGNLDGVIYWTPLHHRAITQVTTGADVRLIPIGREQIAMIQERTERSRFLKSTTIPKGTYPHQDQDVLTLGEDILLLCRRDLPESLVYQLTKVLFDSVAVLANAHPAANGITLERGPTTSIELHPGAARYYREREVTR